MRVRVPTILVTGPVGVGKTTLIEAMGRLLRDADPTLASVDFHQLTACYPRLPDDDGWGTDLGLTNLAALWRNYSARGADRLLLARVIEDRTELDGYRAAVPGAEMVWCGFAPRRPPFRNAFVAGAKVAGWSGT